MPVSKSVYNQTHSEPLFNLSSALERLRWAMYDQEKWAEKLEATISDLVEVVKALGDEIEFLNGTISKISDVIDNRK